MAQAYNPYLPSWEYIPDGEPHVFDGRVYVYGSHDRFNAPMFCMNDYVCWSAPVDDLGDWRYEGVIYRKTRTRRTGWACGSSSPRTCAGGPTGGTTSTTPSTSWASWGWRCATPPPGRTNSTAG